MLEIKRQPRRNLVRIVPLSHTTHQPLLHNTMSLRSTGKGSRSTETAAEAARVSPAFYKELQDTFRLYDSEGTGYLSTKKLQLAMRTVGFEASLSDIQEIVEGIPNLSVHKSKRGKGNGGKKNTHPSGTSGESVRRSSRRAAQDSRKGQKSKYVDDSGEDTDEDDSDQDTYRDKGGDSEEEEDDQPYRFTFNDFVIIMTPGNVSLDLLLGGVCCQIQPRALLGFFQFRVCIKILFSRSFYFLSLQEQFEQDELSRVFQLFDKQGKGYIRMEDLKRIAGELGIPMSDLQLEEMIDEADRDGNGAVTAEEFGRVMKKTGLA